MSDFVAARGVEFPEIRPPELGRATTITPENVADALSETNSRRVLAACVDTGRSAKELSVMLSMPLATVYRQIHRLIDLAVLVVERSAMTPDGKKYDLYRSRILEAHLDVSGEREEVRWIANDAVEGRITGTWDAFRTEARRRGAAEGDLARPERAR